MNQTRTSVMCVTIHLTRQIHWTKHSNFRVTSSELSVSGVFGGPEIKKPWSPIRLPPIVSSAKYRRSKNTPGSNSTHQPRPRTPVTMVSKRVSIQSFVTFAPYQSITNARSSSVRREDKGRREGRGARATEETQRPLRSTSTFRLEGKTYSPGWTKRMIPSQSVLTGIVPRRENPPSGGVGTTGFLKEETGVDIVPSHKQTKTSSCDEIGLLRLV